MHCILNSRKSVLIIVLFMMLFSACKSSNNSLNSDDQSSGYASALSRVELVNNDVISIADAAGSLYNGAYMRTSRTTLGTCATVGTDTVSQPHTLTIRFGDADCTCLDGRIRRGTIIVSYYGEYTDTEQVHTITYSNYFINDNQLSGSVKVTRIDTTVTGDWYYNVQVNDSLNMSPDPLKSQYIVWAGNLVRRWAGGKATPDRGDDIFSISGSSVLTLPDGHVYSCAIATPLQFALGCDFAESGVVNVTGYEGLRVLNYGAGSCDPSAQLNVGTNLYQLTLTK